MEWNVEAGWTIAGTEDGEATAEQLMSMLADWSPAASVKGDQLTLLLTVHAPSAMDALAAVTARVENIFADLQIRFDGPLHTRADRYDQFEASLSHSLVPRLSGIAEIAAELQVSRQRASELSRQNSFPSPLARLAAGPIWLESSVKNFASNWIRKPGRTSKAGSQRS